MDIFCKAEYVVNSTTKYIPTVMFDWREDGSSIISSIYLDLDPDLALESDLAPDLVLESDLDPDLALESDLDADSALESDL